LAWRRFSNSSGQLWQINNEALWLLLIAYYRVQYMNKTAKVTQQVENIAPLVTLAQSTVNVNWTGATGYAQASAHQLAKSSFFRKDTMSINIVERLAQLRADTTKGTAQFRSLLNWVNNSNMAGWQAVDKSLGQTINLVKTIRDVDQMAFMVVAGFMTGGAGWVALGGGSALSGAYKWLDTKSLSSALTTTAGTFFVGAIPLGGTALRDTVNVLGKAVPKQLVVIGATSVATFGQDVAVSYVDGKTLGLKGALVDAGMSIPAALVGERADNLALPVKTLIGTSMAYSSNLVSNYADQEGPDDYSHTAPTAAAVASPVSALASARPLSDKQYILDYVLRPVG
jgi:hypothetical protein